MLINRVISTAVLVAIITKSSHVLTTGSYVNNNSKKLSSSEFCSALQL